MLQDNIKHCLPIPKASASVLLILAGFAVGLILAETAVRMLGFGRPVFYAYSSTRGWKLRAGAMGWQLEEGHAFVRVNRWGYRGVNWTRSKPKETLRIAVLGDSFIEAQQVAEHDTGSQVIQRELNRILPTIARGRYRDLARVEVMNFGVDGYGTAQEFFTLIQHVWEFSPDIVVLAFFPGNDVRNNSVALEGDKCRPFFVARGNQIVLGGPFEDSRLFHFQCFMRFESYRSQLLNILGEARSAVRRMQRNSGARTGRHLVSYQPVGNAIGRLHEPGINDLIYGPPINHNWRDAWNVSEAEIAMTEQNARVHHALFLLVIIGTGIQVMPDAAFQAQYLRAVRGTDLDYPSHRLIALARRKGFPVLDLVTVMSTYAQDHHVYFHGFPNTVMGTGHWNELGNRFAGTLIARRIVAIVGESQRG